MKKILLSIIIFIGLISFSNTHQTLKKASTKITGPRYRVEATMGVFDKDEISYWKTRKFYFTSLSFLTEWKAQFNNRIDVTFGPKITANAEIIHIDSNSKLEYIPSLILGIQSDFNYKLKEDFKIYSGIEIGVGIGIKFPLNNNTVSSSMNGILNNSGIDKLRSVTLAKLSIGLKMKDRYNVGIYTGHTKGIFGVELGYTF
ncbi:hypothetical protein [Streptobacillus moniliformis]|uniref:hypothetical protein n=1 Tax=Streptobacillus moniliformis TaxID=34105 RepID=UPI0007E369ED|nr:hypothetical protein [Streptobacillus moniliformis]